MPLFIYWKTGDFCSPHLILRESVFYRKKDWLNCDTLLDIIDFSKSICEENHPQDYSPEYIDRLIRKLAFISYEKVFFSSNPVHTMLLYGRLCAH